MANSNSTVGPGAEWNGIDMNIIFSPFYWGSVFSLILYGITLLQAYMYFPGKDKWFIQLFAAVLLALDTVSVALVSQGFAYYIIPHFGSVLPLAHLTPTLAVECTIGMVTIFMSQSYFAWQVYTVMPRGTNKYVVPGLIFFLAVITGAAGIACSVVMFVDNENILADRSITFSVAAGVSKGMAAVCDIVATIALCYSLASARTGFKQTDHLVKSVITWVVQRGLLVSVIQSLVLIVFFAKQANLYWLPLHVNVTRLYVNTFFAMLNGRQNLKKSYDSSSAAGSWGVRVDTLRSSDATYQMKNQDVTSRTQVESGGEHDTRYLTLSKASANGY